MNEDTKMKFLEPRPGPDNLPVYKCAHWISDLDCAKCSTAYKSECEHWRHHYGHYTLCPYNLDSADRCKECTFRDDCIKYRATHTGVNDRIVSLEAARRYAHYLGDPQDNVVSTVITRGGFGNQLLDPKET